MTKLHLLAGITPSLQRLLEAGGVASVEDLAQQDPKELADRLARLSRKNRVVAPARKQVDQMVQLARKLVPPPATPGVVADDGALGDLTVNLDQIPEAIAVPSTKPSGRADARTSAAPPARPPAAAPAAKAAATASAPKSTSRPVAHPTAPANGPAVTAAAPPAVMKRPPVIARPPAEQTSVERPQVEQPKVEQSAVERPQAERTAAESQAPAPVAPPAASVRPPARKQKFRDFQAYTEGRMGIDPLPRKSADDESEVEGALQRINHKPGQPIPRHVRRGVPHPRPFFLVFCSLIVLVSRLLMMAVIIGTPVVLWPAFMHGDTTHLLNFLWVIGAWALSGVAYLVLAVRARCRVCTNPIFWSKRCMKNAKAHRLRGLGLVGSLALHALLFGWFRCMYCGTAIRLKFVADPERTK